MAKSIIYWLLPETMTYVDVVADEPLLEVIQELEGEFPNSFRMPGTRTQEGWQVVNMLSIKPDDKNNMFVSLKQRMADVGWDVRKIPPGMNWNAVKAQLQNAPAKTAFFALWHHPSAVIQYRENGTPVMVGTGEEATPKKVHPVYDRTPDWWIEFQADVVVGGTDENPVYGRPASIPLQNRWVHQDDFADFPDEVDEIVPDNTPDEP